eukprot:m.65480 g.65480  ORF g.65480 m.65480 type:complete len:73 (-) comp15919_c0_seq1:1092-1310(-)
MPQSLRGNDGIHAAGPHRLSVSNSYVPHADSPGPMSSCVSTGEVRSGSAVVLLAVVVLSSTTTTSVSTWETT